MKDDDSFFGLFKESSESERNFDFKRSGWDKLDNRLNQDKAEKRRKFLFILPWMLLPGLLMLNAILYTQQKDTNKQLSDLQQQLTDTKQARIDTIVKEKHIYTHDTVYVFITNKSGLTNSGNNVLSNNEQNNNGADVKTVLLTEVKQGSTLSNVKSTSEEEIFSGNDGSDTLNGSLLNNLNSTDSSTLKTYGLIEETINDSTFFKTNNQSKNDSIAQNDSLAKTIVAIKDTLNKEKVSLKEKMGNIKLEYGIRAGGVFPKNKTDVNQIGFNAGIGVNALFSKRINLTSNLNYTGLWVHTQQQQNKIAWIPFEPSPDSTYKLDNASTYIASFNIMLGLRYNLPLAENLNLLFDLGYGAHYILPYKVIYEFKNNNKNQDLIVEKNQATMSLLKMIFCSV